MHQKIWQKVLVLFMTLAVLMPKAVQAVEIIVMSESEEVADQNMEETSLEEEPQIFNEELPEEIIEVEPIVEENMSTNLEEKEHLIIDEELEGEEPIDSNVDVTSTNVLVNNMEFSFSGTNGNSTATLVGYHGTGGNVVIPATVLNTQAGWGTPSPVTLIGINAFRSKGLTNVNIPSGVTEIGNGAFSFNDLTSVNIPNSVTIIQSGVFSNNKLTSVELPINLRTIASDSFANNSLTSVNIKSGDITIGPNAFRNNNIESIYIHPSVRFSGGGMFESNPLKYIEVNLANVEASRGKINSSVLSGVSERTILRALDYEIGTNSVSNIAFGADVSYAISQQYQLQSTTNRVWEEYTPTVQWAKNGVNLSGQTGPILKLDSVTPSDSGVYHAVVDTIRYSDLSLEVEDPAEFVFEYRGTDGDSTATLVGYNGDGGAVVIPSEAVNSEKGWEGSSEVTAIGADVFKNKRLTSVEIPNSVTIIGYTAFYNNNLSSVTIPNSITNIGTGAFARNPLKFIETSVENVETLRSILTATAMVSVDERTILRALDYEIGTEIEQVASVDQTIDFAISQQYQLRSTQNPVWDSYVPDVQWEKDGIAIEGGLHKVLHLTDIQEIDSGIYKAVVDGTIFPDIQLQVIPSIDPEIPSVDPNEPSVSPEGVNPTIEGLSIRYASDIRFKAAPFSLSDQTLPLDIQENQPMVTVQDMRPRDERSGWELLVSQDSSFMNGAEIVMNPFIHQENQTNLLIEGASELILNDEPQRFAGTAMTEEPNPFGILSIGMGSGENPMTLRVPGKTGVNSYETTVHWQLVTGP